MINNKVVKAITLGFFILLLSGFIVFKTGGFDSFLVGENEAVVPLVKADSMLPGMHIDTQKPFVSDTPYIVPSQVLHHTLPSPHSQLEGMELEKPPEPAHVDSFYLDVISMSSKSAIGIDQGKFILELDSIMLSDSTYLKY